MKKKEKLGKTALLSALAAAGIMRPQDKIKKKK
jgi:hypothetical protein